MIKKRKNKKSIKFKFSICKICVVAALCLITCIGIDFFYSNPSQADVFSDEVQEVVEDNRLVKDTSGEVMTLATDDSYHNDLEVDKQEENLELGNDEDNLLLDNVEDVSLRKENLMERLQAICGDSFNNTGIVYYNTVTGEYIALNENTSYFAASTVKVPIAMVVADKLYNGELSEDTIFYYDSSDYEEGTGIMINQDLSVGFNVITLLENMLVYSDNIATNMLLRNLGYTQVKDQFSNYLGYELSTYENYMTPQEGYLYLKALYDNKDGNPYYDLIIDYLKNTVFHDRIDRNMEYDSVAHKIGSYGEYIHDIGIVYGNEPFILAVYTNGANEADNLISNIADLFYEYSN